MSDEFKPGQRVEIQDRDRDPDRYPQATIVKPATHAEFIGYQPKGLNKGPGYFVRYDNGCVVWVQERDVLAMRNPDSRIVEKAVEAMKADGWHAPLIGDDLDDDVLYRIAQTVLRAAERWQAQQVESEFAAMEQPAQS